ncbi:hypothetical protein NFI96_026934 [Prochilodus magdalenae]|nr:hypothetical protein NFI96_026934 [Prochilodus magdalenae]
MLPTGHCPQDAAHKMLPTGHCPQDAAHKMLPTGHCPQDAAHKTLPTRRCPQDAAHKTLPTGHFPQDAAHKTLPTRRYPQDPTHRTLPTRHCPQDATHKTLPTGCCPQDAAHRTLPTRRCPQDAAHKTLPTGPYPQDPTHKTLPTRPYPQDDAHMTLPTRRYPQDTAHKTLPARYCPQDTAHKTLPTRRCPQDTSQKTMPTRRCPQDPTHKTLPTRPYPQDAAHKTLDSSALKLVSHQSRSLVLLTGSRHVTVAKDCYGVVPDCHGVTQNDSRSSSVASSASVLVETTNESVCGGTVVSTEMNGVHAEQRLECCELRSDNKPGGMKLIDAFNGLSGFELDFNINQHSVHTDIKWPIVFDSVKLEYHRNLYAYFLQPLCIGTLERYLKEGRNHILRKVKPRVRLLMKPHADSGGACVSCLATGFYPRHINLTLLRNGQPLSENLVSGGELLPNGDGTYQMRQSLEISAEELQQTHNYTCTATHLSLDNKLDIHWGPGAALLSFSLSCRLVLHEADSVESGEEERGPNWSTYKLIVDPVLKGGTEKLYRYDGQHFSSPVSRSSVIVVDDDVDDDDGDEVPAVVLVVVVVDEGSPAAVLRLRGKSEFMSR